MKQVTLAEFLDGYEQGYITDVAVVGTRVYGKDPRGCAGKAQLYQVVWAQIT